MRLLEASYGEVPDCAVELYRPCRTIQPAAFEAISTALGNVASRYKGEGIDPYSDIAMRYCTRIASRGAFLGTRECNPDDSYEDAAALYNGALSRAAILAERKNPSIEADFTAIATFRCRTTDRISIVARLGGDAVELITEERQCFALAVRQIPSTPDRAAGLADNSFAPEIALATAPNCTVANRFVNDLLKDPYVKKLDMIELGEIALDPLLELIPKQAHHAHLAVVA